MSNLDSLPFLTANRVKKVYKDICTQFDLVYFGNVSQHSDDHQMVRGFTLSPSHVDRHYCVGTVSGRDIILLERTDTVSFPDKPSKAYTWVILQVDLKKSAPLHLVLNSFHYEAPVYDTLFSKLQHLHQASPVSLPYYDQLFLQRFHVYSPLQYIDHLHTVLAPDTAATMAHHFAKFDYELLDDELIIYASMTRPSTKDIEDMTRAGVWLADQIEKSLSATHLE